MAQISEDDQEQWAAEASEEEEEVPEEEKAKQEAEEAMALEKALRPGGRLYLWCNSVFRTNEIKVQFTIDETSTEIPGIYKGPGKIGVEIPDLGEHTAAAEVAVEASLNGQEFSCNGKMFRYLGANAPEEKAVARRK